MNNAELVIKELKKVSNKTKAGFLQKYFKTGVGEYGEGDIFIGVTVPVMRSVARVHKDIELPEVLKLLSSEIHEHRFVALEILVFKYEQATKLKNSAQQKKIFNFYIKNKKYINNWDLVDTSVEYIVGVYLEHLDKDILYTLAKSKRIWDRRIAVIATFAYIKKGEFKESLKIIEMLMQDTHDLIHKACGWMLREIGKRFKETEVAFLAQHYKTMPRTMLRYSIEHFSRDERDFYLHKIKM
ncbi:MAG: DNA alkylation repair protein [Patescibacteria group bacterium]